MILLDKMQAILLYAFTKEKLSWMSRSKRFISKDIFMSSAACPRWDPPEMKVGEKKFCSQDILPKRLKCSNENSVNSAVTIWTLKIKMNLLFDLIYFWNE